jgi:ABC-type dipeptide/oligopeptide/nickel transport system permease component
MSMTTIQEIVDSNSMLYPKLFTQFLQNTVSMEITPSKLVQEIIQDNECSVPIIIRNINDNEPIFFATKKKERLKFTLNYLKNKPEYTQLYNYITSLNAKLLGISINRDYIRKAISSNVNNKGYCPPQLKNKNTGWMLLIDIKDKLIGFIVLDVLVYPHNEIV